MKEQTLKAKIMQFIAAIGFKLFIWGNQTTPEKYWQEIWEQENRERAKIFTPQPEEDEIDMWDYRNHIQNTTAVWMHLCFPEPVIYDKTERNFRFLEEALELVQANGATRSQAMELVEYVFARPVGEVLQETGGVMVTLAALCNILNINMESAYWLEHNRIMKDDVIAKIRLKQETKPKGSPLPGTGVKTFPDGGIIEGNSHGKVRGEEYIIPIKKTALQEQQFENLKKHFINPEVKGVLDFAQPLAGITPMWLLDDNVYALPGDEVYCMLKNKFGYFKNPKLEIAREELFGSETLPAICTEAVFFSDKKAAKEHKTLHNRKINEAYLKTQESNG